MATHIQNLQTFLRGDTGRFSWRQFIREQLLSSWWKTLWLLLLAYITFRVVVGQFATAPVTTGAILLVWLALISITAIGGVLHRHTSLTFWLSENLFNSVTGALISLVIILLLLAGVRGFIGWAFVRASFSTDPDIAAQELSQWENPGAKWGAVID
ncbi:MAG TPA: hypothetical protein PLR07_15055, partial [Promineifilum sp.]|nr:hypothetical protein [Promineifilum sp.]